MLERDRFWQNVVKTAQTFLRTCEKSEGKGLY
jgi:hypothetical protein